jgi:hypothetical protein
MDDWHDCVDGYGWMNGWINVDGRIAERWVCGWMDG